MSDIASGSALLLDKDEIKDMETPTKTEKKPKLTSISTRARNFTDEKLEALMREAGKHAKTLKGRFQPNLTNEIKTSTWMKICDIVNSVNGLGDRTWHNCRKKWQDVMSKARNKTRNAIEETRKTGGGTRTADRLTSVEQLAMDSVSEVSVRGISTSLDSNAVPDYIPRTNSELFDNNVLTQETKFHAEMEDGYSVSYHDGFRAVYGIENVDNNEEEERSREPQTEIDFKNIIMSTDPDVIRPVPRPATFLTNLVIRRPLLPPPPEQLARLSTTPNNTRLQARSPTTPTQLQPRVMGTPTTPTQLQPRVMGTPRIRPQSLNSTRNTLGANREPALRLPPLKSNRTVTRDLRKQEFKMLLKVQEENNAILKELVALKKKKYQFEFGVDFMESE